MTDQSYTISRSEQKRRARNLEKLAHELSELSSSDIRKLPCDSDFKQEISDVRGLKAGARKRQLKYIAKTLRQMDPEPLFAYLAKRKGSKLQDRKDFKLIERLRDDILNDAISAFQEAEGLDEREEVPRPVVWSSGALNEALAGLPNLDERELRSLAERYARTRKPAHSRELFRLLKAAQERAQYQKQLKKS